MELGVKVKVAGAWGADDIRIHVTVGKGFLKNPIEGFAVKLILDNTVHLHSDLGSELINIGINPFSVAVAIENGQETIQCDLFSLNQEQLVDEVIDEVTNAIIDEIIEDLSGVIDTESFTLQRRIESHEQ